MKHILILLIGVFFVSFTGSFVQLSDIEISVLAMYRLGIGGGLLLIFALKDQNFYKLKRKELVTFFIAGLILSIHYLSYFKALTLTTITSTTLIICTQPLVALAFGYFLYKEKITRLQFFVLLASLFGVGVVAKGDIEVGVNAILGDLLTFIAVVLYVIYLIIGKQVIRKYSFIIYTSILFLTASLILLAYNLLNGFNLVDFSVKNWMIIVLMAIIPNAGQVMFIYVLKYLKSSVVATAILLEPFIATILAIILVGQKLIYTQVIGGLVIVLSVFVYMKLEEKEQNIEITT